MDAQKLAPNRWSTQHAKGMKKYAIIDIETTGGNPFRDKITEIAIVLHNGEEIIDTYETLLNPERYIPAGITELTGITQQMVEEAPKFYEVAKKIVEMTKGAVFVAHNVRFDYGFVKKEFSRLGYAYTRKQLCTVRLSRKTFPGLKSYSLSNLIRHFDLPITYRHRAMGDTMATVKLFELILNKEASQVVVKDMINLGIKESLLPQGLDIETIHAVPESCGVYYFHDERGNVVYVGKSINLRKRVAEHFSDITKKGSKMHRFVRDITYEVTGSEMIALLLESYEIKRLQPPINRAQKGRQFPYIIYHWKDDKGYIRFEIDKVKKKEREKLAVAGEFPSVASARRRLSIIQERFELCNILAGKEKGHGACFAYHLKQCHGACKAEEEPHSYNERAKEAIPYLSISFDKDFILFDEGRTHDEKSVVLVENNEYQGFGFIDAAMEDCSIEDIRASIKQYPHTVESMRIIIRQVSKKSQIKILEIS